MRRPSDDEFDYIFDTPRKALLRKKLKKSTLLNLKHRKVIKTLKQKTRRLQKRNKSLKGILSELQKKRFISNDVSNLLSENVFAADLFNNMVKKIKKDKKRPMPKYTPEFRKFCLTLHYHSPRAYTYVRNTFDTCLPHPKTLYNWYCSIDGSPGFTNESFKLLKSKSQSSDKTLICGLIADEMAIRPQNIKGGLGNVDVGTGTTSGIKASQAYVFMLVCLNERWKIPLGYFLIHSLEGKHKKNLINICLAKCHDAGIKVVSLTFDGHPTNISAMELLGCRVKDPKNMKTTFKHPSSDHEVAVFLDPCHMIKLIRNHWEDKSQFLDEQKNVVDWNYLVLLNDLQDTEGLNIANKLTRRHLEFRNTIMKVKLAMQLLSRSVSISLKFCRETLKLDKFEKSAGTENFIMLLNDLFDVFNSRRLTQYGFCRPLSKDNKVNIFDLLEKAKKYILNLSIKTTRKRTYHENEAAIRIKVKSFESVLSVQSNKGFKGMLICIESLKHLYKTLVEDTKEMVYISTYRLSQDHLELFFGMIRMNGGHNDNPNVLQFKGAYRKLLCHMELQAVVTGNCVPLEDISVLTCSSAIKCINQTTFSERFDDDEEQPYQESERHAPDVDIASLIASTDDPNYKNYVVGYIAGNVARYLMKKIKCNFCIDSMLTKEKLWFHKLVTLRDNGGLIYVSEAVYLICGIAENYFRKYMAETNNLDKTSETKLALTIMEKLVGRSVFPDAEEHVNEKNHVNNLSRLIIERYLRIRLFYESKKDNVMKTALSKRQLLRKQIQFTGF